MTAYLYNLKIPIEKDGGDLKQLAAESLGLEGKEVLEAALLRKSLDARKKPQLFFNLKLRLRLQPSAVRKPGLRKKLVKEEPEEGLPKIRGEKVLQGPPVVCGSGPAGLFCALVLAEGGLAPVVLERGARMEKRVQAVEDFWKKNVFNPVTNVPFGEGGAGTFSDGKLTARTQSPLTRKVLETFVEAGADPGILTAGSPHVGTDALQKVVVAIRERICCLGGSFRFETALEDLSSMEDGDGWKHVREVRLHGGGTLKAGLLVLATGHSARDTTRNLIRRGLPFEGKGFSLGARIEHPASLINRCQYGREDQETLDRLGNSEYHLTSQGERGVYSFCMCPGGVVVPSNSFPGEVVTNGMSYSARKGALSNSAIVVTVSPEDFGGGALEGLAWQEAIEQKAYQLAGGYLATGQNAQDFVEGRESREVSTGFQPTYKPGIRLGNLWEILPKEVAEAMRRGLLDFDRKLPGFVSQGFLTGPETRTSSPVRLKRDENLKVLGYNNLYAAGEGAGYAGGIVSAGADGIRAALAILQEYGAWKEEEQ